MATDALLRPAGDPGSRVLLIPLIACLAALPASGAQPAPSLGVAPTPESGRSTRQLLMHGGIAIEEGDHAVAEARFREAVDLDPRLAQAHFGLSLAALGRGDRRAADKALRRTAELAPAVPEVLYVRGVAALTYGDARQAEAHLQAAAGADRTFLEARYALGIAAARRGELKAAEAALREALRLDQLHAASRYQLGAVLARAGDLDGALSELSRAIGRQPGLIEAKEGALFVFAPRAVPPATVSSTLGLPLPTLRPALKWARQLPSSQAPPGIPDWYLYYQMALQFEEADAWQGAVDMLEKALLVKDRSEALAVVADRLVDYAPHLHLARAHHRLGDFQSAFLHLGLARNQGEAAPEAWQALNVLIQKDRLRPRIHLDPLPDRTPEEALTIRGLVMADEPVQSVEVSGREAILRQATTEEVAQRLPGQERAASRGYGAGVLFEVAGLRLEEGTNVISVRPRFRNPARNGDLLEARVVRISTPPAEEPKPAPPEKQAAPKGGPRKGATRPKPAPTGPGASPDPPRAPSPPALGEAHSGGAS